ncbi:MAG: PQQ-like beta-propeller repeat protein [Planctomycetes bacterium]|nr:PQQ-like beta-propeller repeat protein [Planctomycetota bacterium]
MQHKAIVTLLVALGPGAGAVGDDWPQWRGPRRDGVWREEGIVERLPEKLTFKWRVEIGPGYAGPAVAGGRVYVTERGLAEGVRGPDDPFDRKRLRGVERLLALDAETGALVWRHEYPCEYEIQYPSGPRATPTVHEGKVYSAGAMGDLVCLDAQGGKVLWSRSLLKDFKGEINTWGFAAAPLVDGGKVIAVAGGRPGAAVVALDKDSGAELWRALDVEDFGYSPPVIIEAGGKRQLVQWTPAALSSLDPETGKLHWQEPFRLQAGLALATPIHDPAADLLLVTAFYNGPLMMKLSRDAPEAKLLWKGKSSSEHQTDGLHAIICTPAFQDGHIYGVCSYGQLRCLEAATGKRLWETLEATGSGRWWNAFLVKHRDRFFIANEQGDLITARLSPEGYKEESRAKLIEATQPIQRRKVVWSHPAFALRSVFARNDREIVRADLAAR